MPSFAVREAFLPALAMPFVRRMVSAFSRLPPASSSARLQSIMPALVFSRSCLTIFGSISALVLTIGKRLGLLRRLQNHIGTASQRCNLFNVVTLYVDR